MDGREPDAMGGMKDVILEWEMREMRMANEARDYESVDKLLDVT